MRNRKRTLLSLSLLAVIGAMGVVGVLWLTPQRHRITPENIRLIQAGMTQQEVQDLLSAPPGFRARGKICAPCTYTGPAFPGLADGSQTGWVGDEAAVLVFFDRSGRVTYHAPLAVYEEETSLIERLRRWVGL